MRQKHRLGHRYLGTLTFTFDDGYIEKTRIESKEAKGLDGFMEKFLEAVCTVLKGFGWKDCKFHYEGDFNREVGTLMKNIDELGSDEKKFEKFKKLWMEATKKYEIHN